MDNKYEPIRQAAITLGVSIVVAAAFIGWSLPGTPRPQNYEAFVMDNKIVRLDTREGHIVACDLRRCVRQKPRNAAFPSAYESTEAPPAAP